MSAHDRNQGLVTRDGQGPRKRNRVEDVEKRIHAMKMGGEKSSHATLIQRNLMTQDPYSAPPHLSKNWFLLLGKLCFPRWI